MTHDGNGFMDEMEDVAGSAWNHTNGTGTNMQTPAIQDLAVMLTFKDDDDVAPVSVIFQRDLGDTWSIWVGTTFLAVRNPSQGVVISRLVEQIAA